MKFFKAFACLVSNLEACWQSLEKVNDFFFNSGMAKFGFA